MQTLSTYFFSDYRFKTQSLWFRRALYIFLIVECVYYLCYFDLLFGENSIVFFNPRDIGFFRNIAFYLYNSTSSTTALFFILGIIFLSLWNLFVQRLGFLMDLLLWLLVINLHNRIYPALTGGNNLLNQFLFFNCFLSSGFTLSEKWYSPYKICLHNLGVLAIMAQICLLYFLSALAKLGDEEWCSGMALMDIEQIHHFSTYSAPKLPALISLILNYLVLFYQLLFPVLIWIKKIKKPFLLVGIGMHLYIAFVMGLVSFGLIMILGYLFFWPVDSQES